MIARRSQLAGLAAAGFAALAFAAPAAYAGGAEHGPAAGFDMDLGVHTPPPNCPFSTGDLNVLWDSGSVVQHEETNNNGDWGGITVQGSAEFQVDGTTWYTGHATFWGGGGNNKAGQTEGGLTLTFTGTGDAGSLALHVNGHMTTNNAGTPTADTKNVQVVCS